MDERLSDRRKHRSQICVDFCLDPGHNSIDFYLDPGHNSIDSLSVALTLHTAVANTLTITQTFLATNKQSHALRVSYIIETWITYDKYYLAGS